MEKENFGNCKGSQMGIELVQALREFLTANGGMTLNKAQELASDFSEYYFCVDWVTFTKRDGTWKTFKPGTEIYIRGALAALTQNKI